MATRVMPGVLSTIALVLVGISNGRSGYAVESCLVGQRTDIRIAAVGSSYILERVPTGTSLEVLGASGDWLRVANRLSGYVGYVPLAACGSGAPGSGRAKVGKAVPGTAPAAGGHQPKAKAEPRPVQTTASTKPQGTPATSVEAAAPKAPPSVEVRSTTQRQPETPRQVEAYSEAATTAPSVDQAPAQALGWTPFPPRLLDLLGGDGSPFRSPSFRYCYAGPGITQVRPQQLLEVLARSAEAGEAFKALFVARLLTRLRPEVDELWMSRAGLAAGLGLSSEATAARQRQDKAAFLPGARLPRPRSIQDWAAAMAMLSDDTASLEGASAILAVQAGVSGATRAGTGTRVSPIRLDDILPNAFLLRDPVPMKKVKTRGFGFSGLLGLAAYAYGSYTGQSDVAQAGQQLADTNATAADTDRLEFQKKAAKVEDGSFVARTYPGGVAVDQARRPVPAGEYSAVDFPIGLPWASGGATKGSVLARVVTTKDLDDQQPVYKIRTNDKGMEQLHAVRTGKTPWSKLVARVPKDTVRIPQFVRLCQLSTPRDWRGPGEAPGECREDGRFSPTTLLELMITPDEHRLLFPWVPEAPRALPAQLYSSGMLALADGGDWVSDDREDAYLVPFGAHAWLVPPTRAR